MQETSDALDLRGYLVALRRYWATVLLPLVLTVAATAAVTFTQTPIYQSTAEVALEPVRDSDEASLQDLILGTNVINTEVRVLTSAPVSQRVIDDLDLNLAPQDVADKVEVEVVPNTRVVRIRATDDDPQTAASLANGYATAYFDYRRDRALDEIAAARASLTERAEDLQDQIVDIEREIRLEGLTTSEGVSQDSSPLIVQRDTLVEQLAQIENQLSTTGGTAEELRGGGEVLVPAEPARDPIVPQPLRNLALATVLGLFLGVALALLRDYLDDAIRSEDDVRRAAPDATIVGRIGAWDDPAADQKLITLVDPYAGASEEFQAMAANVRFALISRAGRHAAGPDGFARRSVAITSSSAGEGKTTVAGNLAVGAAASGRRVVLVGADLRKPTMAARFGLPEGTGLTDLLAEANRLDGTHGVDKYLIDIGIPRLRVLPAGSIPPNPTELLASGQMAWLHESLTEMADLVIYDTPPVLPVADTLELSQHTDLVFLVVRNETTHRRDLAHAVERLAGVGSELGGIVINGLAGGRGGYGYGGYGGYGYRPQDEYRPRTAAADESDGSVRSGRRRRTAGVEQAGEAGEAAGDAPAQSFSAVTVRHGTPASPAAPPPPAKAQPASRAADRTTDEDAAAGAAADTDTVADEVTRASGQDDSVSGQDDASDPDDRVLDPEDDLDMWLFKNR